MASYGSTRRWWRKEKSMGQRMAGERRTDAACWKVEVVELAAAGRTRRGETPGGWVL
jgi:hypothetical protein